LVSFVLTASGVIANLDSKIVYYYTRMFCIALNLNEQGFAGA